MFDVCFFVVVLEKVGYGVIWQGQLVWNGVVIFVCDSQLLEVCCGLLGNVSDFYSCYFEVVVDGLLVVSLYLFNGNFQLGLKFDYKLVWFEYFI